MSGGANAKDRRATEDRARALALAPSLAPRIAEFETYERLIRQWQKKINLVAAPTLAELWTRHFADSAQIYELEPRISRWADLGSGAGFPGLVLAILLKDQPDAEVHLIESDQRKAAFLRAVSRETGAPTKVHCDRIEVALPKLADLQGVTARALAPLPMLVDWSRDQLLKTAKGVFLKGEAWRDELTAIEPASNLNVQVIESRTNPSARIVVVAKPTA